MYNDRGWWGRMVMGDGSGKVGLWSYRVLAPRSLPLPSFLTSAGTSWRRSRFQRTGYSIGGTLQRISSERKRLQGELQLRNSLKGILFNQQHPIIILI